jgi:hypothetical protein
LCGESAPTGSSWHADLIRRAASAIGKRPAIFAAATADAADSARRFRSVAAHAYDTFDHTQAAKAVASATLPGSLLPSEIGRFREVMDP